MLKKKIKPAFYMLAFAAAAAVFFLPRLLYAETGNIYSCKMVPCYKHPVTGVIEDSGGESAYATGQGMVEGVLGKKGMLEVTDSGKYYLTFKMSLMDYTTKHKFKVQKTGDKGWKSVSMDITKTGKDENGKTACVRVQVPSESCIVRGSMYVEPMGRSVIFYTYPEDYKKGKPSGFKAEKVTGKSGNDTENGNSNGDLSDKEDSSSGSGSSTAGGAETSGDKSSASEGDTEEKNSSDSGDPSQKKENKDNDSGKKKKKKNKADRNGTSDKDNENDSTGLNDNEISGSDISQEGQDSEGSSSVSQGDLSGESGDGSREGSSSDESGGVKSGAGLSLSTEENVSGSADSQETSGSGENGQLNGTAAAEKSTAGTYSVGQWIFIITVSILIAGLILIAVASAVVRYFLNSRWKWSDDEEDD